MTFANWWTSKYGAETKDVTAQDFALMQDAYETGVRDERDACARLVKAHQVAQVATQYDWTRTVGQDLTEAIMERSNV